MNNPNYMVRDLAGKNSIDRDDRPFYTSMIYGLALGDSSEGFVEVKLLGDGKNETSDFLYWKPNKDVGIEERGIFLPTTVSVMQGDLVVITTTGQTERKMIVTGVAGGGDVAANRVQNIDDDVSGIKGSVKSTQENVSNFQEYLGDPILDGTNLLKNASFNSLDNWTVKHSKSTPVVNLTNGYTNGSYKSIKLTFNKNDYSSSITQIYDFSDLMFDPSGDNWMVGSVYWYVPAKEKFSLEFSREISISTSLIFAANDNKISFKSKNFIGMNNQYNNTSYRRWGRYRSIIFLDYFKAFKDSWPLYKYKDPQLTFEISILANLKTATDTEVIAYINRPKLEWGGLPTPWTP